LNHKEHKEHEGEKKKEYRISNIELRTSK